MGMEGMGRGSAFLRNWDLGDLGRKCRTVGPVFELDVHGGGCVYVWLKNRCRGARGSRGWALKKGEG